MLYDVQIKFAQAESMLRSLAAASLFACVWMCAPRAEVRLIPGLPVEFEVPAAPQAMANQLRNQTHEPVRMTIKLPKDYDPART